MSEPRKGGGARAGDEGNGEARFWACHVSGGGRICVDRGGCVGGGVGFVSATPVEGTR